MDIDLYETAGSSPPKRGRSLSKLQRVAGETREVILSHEEAAGRIQARLVKVEGGGVDRATGKSVKVWYETTVKVPREPEVTRIFTSGGDPAMAEWNARVTYLTVQHGIADLSTPLADIEERLWSEPKNLTALAKLRDRFGWPDTLPRTRINTGDSEPECAGAGVMAMVAAPAPGNGVLA